MDINETVLQFKLNVILDANLRSNAFNYVLKIKDFDNKKLKNEIDKYSYCKEADDDMQMKLLYSIVLEYLHKELEDRNS